MRDVNVAVCRLLFDLSFFTFATTMEDASIKKSIKSYNNRIVFRNTITAALDHYDRLPRDYETVPCTTYWAFLPFTQKKKLSML